MAWTAMNASLNLRRLCSTILQPSGLHKTITPSRVLACIRDTGAVTGRKNVTIFIRQSSSLNRNGLKKPIFELLKPAALKNKCINQVCFQRGSIFFLARQFSISSRLLGKQGNQTLSESNTTSSIYILAVFILMIGGAYAAVPLYKVYCQATGIGGQAQLKGQDTDKVEHMQKVDKLIRIRFNADVASSMRWNFRPQQTEVMVSPGETALAFYTAKNPTDKPIIGISTYNILPFDAGQYFNKIQCFCFEEQRLNPNEQVDMPVFFYIDPEFADDPKCENIHTITLSYTFFEAKEGLTLPLPGYPQPHDPPMPV